MVGDGPCCDGVVAGGDVAALAGRGVGQGGDKGEAVGMATFLLRGAEGVGEAVHGSADPQAASGPGSAGSGLRCG